MTRRFLTDENFDNDILRGLLHKCPTLDILRVQDVNLSTTDDPIILEWAASEQRILLTHDANTITKFAYDRVRANQPMPGVIEVRLGLAIGHAIEDILILDECAQPGELEGRVIHIPL